MAACTAKPVGASVMSASRAGLMSIGHLAVLIATVCALVVSCLLPGGLFAPGQAFGDDDEGHLLSINEVYSPDPTEDGLFEVSSKHNVIVFVLDTYDTRDLVRIVDGGSDVLEDFKGFTWYTNTTGSLMPTRFAIPFLLTGELPSKGETWGSYLAGRYLRSSFIGDIRKAGYDVGIYAEDTMLYFVDSVTLRDKVTANTINLHRVDVGKFRAQMAERAAICCTLFPIFPGVLNPRFWYDTTWDDSLEDGYDESAPESTPYECDDAVFYEKLQDKGLTVKDRGENGSFRFIHLDGLHDPINLTADGKRAESGETSIDEQAIGSMRIVDCYLQQLKDLGLYDDATIIVTADHGEWLVLDTLPRPSEPILLYKPSQSHEEASQPLQVTDAEVIHADILPTIAASVGADGTRYSGMRLEERSEDDDEARFFITTIMSDDMTQDVKFVEWEIDGNVLDFDSWHLTGQSWKAPE